MLQEKLFSNGKKDGSWTEQKFLEYCQRNLKPSLQLRWIWEACGVIHQETSRRNFIELESTWLGMSTVNYLLYRICSRKHHNRFTNNLTKPSRIKHPLSSWFLSICFALFSVFAFFALNRVVLYSQCCSSAYQRRAPCKEIHICPPISAAHSAREIPFQSPSFNKPQCSGRRMARRGSCSCSKWNIADDDIGPRLLPVPEHRWHNSPTHLPRHDFQWRR